MRLSILGAALILVVISNGQAQNISVSPTALHFACVPGKMETQTITVTNISDEELFIELNTGDWLRNENGGHQYFDPGSLDNSLHDYLRIVKGFNSIPPGNSATIEVSINIPEGKTQEKMRWSMLFVSSMRPLEEDGDEINNQLSTSIREIFRFGIHIYQIPPTLVQKKATILDLYEGEQGYVLSIENTGEVMLNCKSYLEIIHLETGEVYKTKVVEYPVFPKGIRNVVFDLPRDLNPGKYSLLGVLDYDESMPLEAVELIIDWQSKQKEIE